MKFIRLDKTTLILWLVLVFSMVLVASCDEDLLDKQPLDSLSAGTFWKSESDATLALSGVYARTHNAEEGRNFYGYSLLYLDGATDNGSFANRTRAFAFTSGSLSASNDRITTRWNRSYERIASCNNFLDNIASVEMDEAKKAEITAEVRFLRANQYFWLSQFFGGVPLIKNVITIEEANSQIRATKAEVVQFIEDELDLAAADLPEVRLDAENGRILKGAALAMKGRLLMAEERWVDAAQVYKEIIDMDVFEIDPRYKELFEDEGDGSKEVIFAVKYMQDVKGTQVALTHRPQQFGGWHKIEPFTDLILSYDMDDGLPADKSSRFDPENPYINRDPRLYATCFLPGVSKFQGKIFQAHPDSGVVGDGLQSNRIGYAVRKWVDEGYEGNQRTYGGDFPQIRYAEVLLSYLESKFEAGDEITQQLLDETVNKVRGRAAVNMAPIMLADFSRDRLRNERRVETAWEGLRYWDIMRWKIAHIVCRGSVKGMKLTNDPANYTDYNVDENGYYIVAEKNFKDNNYLWPIPQSELDINPDLGQNPGY